MASTYTVVSGDTWWRIARLALPADPVPTAGEVSAKVTELQAWNPIEAARVLQPGDVIDLTDPGDEPTPSPVPEEPTEPAEDWDEEIAALERGHIAQELAIGELQARPVPIDPTATLTELRTDLDRLLAEPAPEDWSDEIQALTDRIDAWEARPTGGASTGVPGQILFDSLAGSNDSARIAKMNEINKGEQQAGGPMPAFVFGDRIPATTVPIDLRSSIKMESYTRAPSREYTRSAGIKWNGPPGSWLFRFLDPAKGETQYGQGYPSDGSPRDGFVSGLQFSLSPGTHLIQPTDTYQGKTLWYWRWSGCGCKDGATVWIGYGTGTEFFVDDSHVQAMVGNGKSIIDVGGSENVIGGQSGIGFMDTQVAPAGTTLIRSKMEKSSISGIMPTGRKGITPIELYGGRACRVLNMSPDSQGSDPIYGAGIRITGGEGHEVDASCIKGVGQNPAAAPGGAAANAGMIHISGGSQHVVKGVQFIRNDANPGFPVVAVVGTATKVKVGLNAHVGYGDAKARYIGGAAKYASFVADSTAVLE